MKTKLTCIMVALMSMTMGALAQNITNVTMHIKLNGQSEVQSIPATGFPGVDLTDEPTTSFIIEKIEVETEGNVLAVDVRGAMYNEEDGVKDGNWRTIPLEKQSDGKWAVTIGEDLVEGSSTKVKIFEFFAQATTGTGNTIYYNNGGQNYKIRFATEGVVEDWTVKFYKGETATLTLQVNGENKKYTYNGDAIRTQFYGENPGEVTALSIEGFSTTFIYNEEAGVKIASVTLQYRVNVDGAEGQWNGLEARNTGWDDIWNEVENSTDHKLEYTYNGHVNVAGGLTSGHDYVLEMMYQVVTLEGDYKFLRGKDLCLSFTISDANGIHSIEDSAVTYSTTPRYNISGQRVTDNYKGVVIKDGKKVIVK